MQVKVLYVTKCSECAHNVPAAVLALKINRPELMKGRACNAAENFINNANIIQAFCPLEDVNKTVDVGAHEEKERQKSLKINRKIE